MFIFSLNPTWCGERGTWLSPSVEHATFDHGVVNSSCTLGVELPEKQIQCSTNEMIDWKMKHGQKNEEAGALWLRKKKCHLRREPSQVGIFHSLED